MRITGTASHFKNITKAIPVAAKIYLGKLFLRLLFLNFMLIKERLLTISNESGNMIE